MRRLLYALALLVFVCLIPSRAEGMQRAFGWCMNGGVKPTVAGQGTNVFVQGSWPNCTVTVYLQGTLTLATIYSDNSSTPLANPFTASSTGLWFFYAADGHYDVRLSSAGIPSPFTLADIQLGGTGGGGTPGSPVNSVQYNSSGSFAGAAGVTTDGNSLTIKGPNPFCDTNQYAGADLGAKINTASGAGCTNIIVPPVSLSTTISTALNIAAGVHISFPAGNWTWSGAGAASTIANDSVSITGAGAGLTNFLLSSTTANLFAVQGNYFTFKGITVKPAGGVTRTAGSALLIGATSASEASFGTVQNVECQDTFACFDLSRGFSFGWQFMDIFGTSNGGNTAFMFNFGGDPAGNDLGSIQDIRVFGLHIDGWAQGASPGIAAVIFNSNAEDIFIDGIYCTTNNACLYSEDTVTGHTDDHPPEGIRVVDGFVETEAGTGCIITITGGQDQTYDKLHITSGGQPSICGSGGTSITFSNNGILNGSTLGLSGTAAGWKITGNDFSDNQTADITVAAGVKDFHILGNSFDNNILHGGSTHTNAIIIAAGSSDNYQIQNNYIDTTVVTGTPIVDGGSGTNKWITCNLPLSGGCGTGGSGSSALSSLTAATTPNAILNGANGQEWDWHLTGGSSTGMAFSESSAGTGVGSTLVSMGTQTGSTTIPLFVFDSLSGSQTLPAVSIAPVWNTSGVATAFKLNVGHTASGTGSRLMDLQLNSASQWFADKFGNTKQQGINNAVLGFQVNGAAPAFHTLCGNGTAYLDCIPAVTGRVVAGTSDTVTLTGGNQLGVNTLYTNNSAIATSLIGAATNGQYGSADVNGTGPVTWTPTTGQVSLNGGALAATGTCPSHVRSLFQSYDGTNFQIDCLPTTSFSGPWTASTYSTATNCSSAASPSVCGAAAAGSVNILATGTSIVVDTTAVTANSQIFVQADSSLGTKLSVTCSTQSILTTGAPVVTARSAGVSFTISVVAADAVHPVCLSYSIVN